MKRIGIFKAMKLCRDYEKLSAEERQEIREKRLEAIVEYAMEKETACSIQCIVSH